MGAETRSSVLTKAEAATAPAVLAGGPRTSSRARARRAASIPVSPKRAGAACGRSCATSCYLALLLAVFKVYRIEERAFQGRTFQMLVTLALLALPVHYLAPFRWKKPVFVAVSMAGLFWIFGAPGRGDRARLRRAS